MDRITRLRIENVRACERVELEISPFTVLIGENGAGKSTILEALELLRKAAEPSFFAQFYAVHRGMPGLLRKGATGLTLGVVIEDDAGGSRGSSMNFRWRVRRVARWCRPSAWWSVTRWCCSAVPPATRCGAMSSMR